MLSLEPGKGYSLGLKVTEENVWFGTNTQAIHKIPRGQLGHPTFQKSWQVNAVAGT